MKRLAALLVLATLAPGPLRANRQNDAGSLRVERPELEVLLFSLKLGPWILAETLPAYDEGGRILVPFGEICRLLDLGITVDVAQGRAEGFFLREDRTFHLDLVAQRVFSEGRPKRFDPAGIELHADDLYVDTALFGAWLPLRLEVDRYGSLITVRPDEKLPLQLRLERSAQLDRAHAARPGSGPSLPRLDLPYRLWDGPFADQTLRFDHRQGGGGGGSNALQYSTYATADLLKLELGAFLAGTDSGVADSRFSLGRKDPDGGLLGLLHAREATAGDIFHPGLDLIALPRSGPGLLLSNYPFQLPAQFDRHSFRGDLPPGWEVELYRGDELLAYSQGRADGLYEFLDVPLPFGLNVFRLEFYGPQGQRRREVQRLNVGESLTPKGKVYYRLAGNDPGARLVGSGSPGVDRRGSLEVSAGLSPHLSASGGLAVVDLDDGRHTYALGSLRGYWGWLFANASLAGDREGGSAWQGTVQSRLGAFGFLAQHTRLQQFESEALVAAAGGTGGAPGGSGGEGGPALASRTLLRLETALPEGFLPRIPLTLEAREDRLDDGRSVRQVGGRLSAFRRGFFVSNQLTWSAISAGGDAGLAAAGGSTDAFGHLLVSRYLQSGAVRGEADYSLRPRRELRSVLLTGERRLGRGILLSAGVNRTLLGAQTRYLLGASRLEGSFGFSLTADYSRSAGFGVSVLLSESFGRDPRTGVWHRQGRPLAGGGGLSGLAFLDADGNGRRDPGEEAIAGAGFLLNGGGNLARTGDSGVAFVANLQPHQSLEVALSPSTLEDPYWRPAGRGVKIVPRPGKVAQIDLPVRVSGEITGNLYLRRGAVSRIAGSVELELVDPAGAVVQRARSAYDGYYDLAEVDPGRYRLRVAPGEAQRLRLAAAPAREIEIAPTGTIVEGFNFYLTGEEDPAPAVALAAAPERAGGAPLQTGKDRGPGAPQGRPAPMPGTVAAKPSALAAPAALPAAPPWGPRLARFTAPEWRGPEPLFAVQLASCRDRSNADRRARELGAQLRVPVHVFAVDLGAKGRWFRVLAGEMPSAEAALAFRRALQGRGIGEAGPAYEVDTRP